MLCGILMHLNASEGSNRCWMLMRYSNWIRTTDLLCLKYLLDKRSCYNEYARAPSNQEPHYVNQWFLDLTHTAIWHGIYLLYVALQTHQQRWWGTYIQCLNASKIFRTTCCAAAQHRQAHAGSPWCHRCRCSHRPAGATSAVSSLCDLSCFPPQNIASQHPKKQPHKPGEEDVFICTWVSIHLSYKMFTFKDLPTGTLGLSAFLVQALPVCECYLLQQLFGFNQ